MGDHASELEGIVFVGFSFDVGPSPGFLVGGADEGLQSERLSEVVDPARGAAGLHDDEVDFLAFEDGGEVSRVGCRGEEPVLASSGVKEAAHGVEFAEVKSENIHVTSPRRSWRVIDCD